MPVYLRKMSSGSRISCRLTSRTSHCPLLLFDHGLQRVGGGAVPAAGLEENEVNLAWFSFSPGATYSVSQSRIRVKKFVAKIFDIVAIISSTECNGQGGIFRIGWCAA